MAGRKTNSHQFDVVTKSRTLMSIQLDGFAPRRQIPEVGTTQSETKVTSVGLALPAAQKRVAELVVRAVSKDVLHALTRANAGSLLP